MTGFRTVAEIGIGVLFGIGALFNTVYTLRRGDELYRSFVEGAWLPPVRRVTTRIVLPNATAFTIVFILFQGTVSSMILSRGDLVPAALLAGAAFAVVAALASSPGGTVGNLALAAIQISLAVLH